MKTVIEATVAGGIAREVAIPLGYSERFPSQNPVIFRSGSDPASGCAWLEVECSADFDEDRPPYWPVLKAALKGRGFELESDGLVGEEDEVFVPTTFQTADAMILGRKGYGLKPAREAAADMEAILACLPLASRRRGGLRSRFSRR